MSQVYLVTYDLNKPGQDYEKLKEKLKSFNGNCKILESVWLVCSYEDADAVQRELKPYVDGTSSLFVTKVTHDYSGLLTDSKWEWIYRHVK